MVDPIDIILSEAEFTFDTLDVDRAYDIFNQSYLKATGKSWEKNKFIERAANWTFYGDDNGYVAVRIQGSGMVKLVGVAGSPKSIYKGIQEIKGKYSSTPVWGMVSKDIANQTEKMGFKVLRLKNDISSKIFLKLIKTLIPSSVFGGAEIKGINSDGTINFVYSDVGDADKVLVGNDEYFNSLKEKILSNDTIPEYVKGKITGLFSDSGLISEKRREGEKNKKQEFREALSKYAERDDIYVTFTRHPKAGMNPQSDFDTPLGIYCYPLKKAVEYYGFNSDGFVKWPYANERPYLYILKVKPSESILMMSKYTKDQAEKDINHLLETYKDNLGGTKKEFYENAESTTYDHLKQYPIGTFWNVCRLLSVEIPGKNIVNWNKLLRKDLGYGLVVDDAGYSCIHSNEPVQAFFTESSAFEIVDYLINTQAKKPEAEKNIDPRNKPRKIKHRKKLATDFSVISNNEKYARSYLKFRGADTEIKKLIDYAEDKEKILDIILREKGKDISPYIIGNILKISEKKSSIFIDKILSIKGKYLTPDDARAILDHPTDYSKFNEACEKILDLLGNRITPNVISKMIYGNIGISIRYKILSVKGKDLDDDGISAILRDIRQYHDRNEANAFVDKLLDVYKDKLTYDSVIYIARARDPISKEFFEKVLSNIPYNLVSNELIRIFMERAIQLHGTTTTNPSQKDNDDNVAYVAKKLLSFDGLSTEQIQSVLFYARGVVKDILGDINKQGKPLDSSIISMLVSEAEHRGGNDGVLNITRKILENKSNYTRENIGLFLKYTKDVSSMLEVLRSSLNINDKQIFASLVSLNIGYILEECKNPSGMIKFITDNIDENNNNLIGTHGSATLINFSDNPKSMIEQLLSKGVIDINRGNEISEMTRDIDGSSEKVLFLKKVIELLAERNKPVEMGLYGQILLFSNLGNFSVLTKYVTTIGKNMSADGDIKNILTQIEDDDPRKNIFQEIIKFIIFYKKEELTRYAMARIVSMYNDLFELFELVKGSKSENLLKNIIQVEFKQSDYVATVLSNAKDPVKTMNFMLDNVPLTADLIHMLRFRVKSADAIEPAKRIINFVLNNPEILTDNYTTAADTIEIIGFAYKGEDYANEVFKVLKILNDADQLDTSFISTIIRGLDQSHSMDLIYKIIELKNGNLSQGIIEYYLYYFPQNSNQFLSKLSLYQDLKEWERILNNNGSPRSLAAARRIELYLDSLNKEKESPKEDLPELIEEIFDYKEYFKGIMD